MAANLRNEKNSISLTVKIQDAGRHLLDRKRLVGVRSSMLAQNIRKQMASPVLLLSAGGIGFLIGELTQRNINRSRGADGSPGSDRSSFKNVNTFFRVALNLTTWARALLAALPVAQTQPTSQFDAPVQISEQTLRSPAAPSNGPIV